MYTVDIDTGGTMTDGLVWDGTTMATVKVDTTPHDLTVSFRELLGEAAHQLGFGDLRAFLDEVSLIRWSSTITSNTLAERKGAKLGLLVRPGNERSLYGDGPSPAVGTLVAERNVVGVGADAEGQSADGQAVLEAVRRLLEDGARRICVSLDSFPETSQEQAVKRIVESQYRDHYLGSVPVLLASDMAQVDDGQTRTHYALINAYVHSQLASSLFKTEDLLRYEQGWTGALLVGHTNGGVARVGKTKAVDTIESGPVFGTHAAGWYARRYGLDRVVCLDVGGTTAKASVVEAGEPRYTRDGSLFGIPVRVPLALLRSAPLGGGSIVRPDGRGGVTLGPESMGAAPGPACYRLGGDQATLTDAFVVLGYLDPAGFLGGRRRLDVDQARAALERRVAGPLGVSVDDAARRIADAAVGMVAELVGSTMARAGIDPGEAVLFAYGGNGGLFAAPVAERLSLPGVRIFGLGPVLSAFGSAVSDVVHVYERSLGVAAAPGRDAVVAAAAEMTAAGRRDLAGEGFDPDEAETDVELDLHDGGDHRTVRAASAVQALERLDGAAHVDVVRVRVRRHLATCQPPPRAGAGRAGAGCADTDRADTDRADTDRADTDRADTDRADTDRGDTDRGEPTLRTLLLADGGTARVPVHDWTGLAPGRHVDGPALAAGGSMTCLVPPGWVLDVDDLGDAALRRARSDREEAQ
jgi:N-methylhydantoinase A/oxoprolinase/acetone carboxylase beta subunit